MFSDLISGQDSILHTITEWITEWRLWHLNLLCLHLNSLLQCVEWPVKTVLSLFHSSVFLKIERLTIFILCWVCTHSYFILLLLHSVYLTILYLCICVFMYSFWLHVNKLHRISMIIKITNVTVLCILIKKSQVKFTIRNIHYSSVHIKHCDASCLLQSFIKHHTHSRF